MLRKSLPIFSLSLWLSSIANLGVFAQTSPTLVNQNYEFDSFWQTAAELVQKQLNILHSIERSFVETRPEQAQSTYTRIFLHLGEVERFLRSQYPIPQSLCNSVSHGISSLTVEQEKIYCTLYQNTPKLQPFLAILDRQRAMLEGVNPNRILPDSERTPLINNLGEPITAQSLLIPDPLPQPGVIGVPQKQSTDLPEAVIKPALASNHQLRETLDKLRQDIKAIQALFPVTIDFYNPVENEEFNNNYIYSVLPKIQQLYADFLAQPQTGIAKIIDQDFYQTSVDYIPNRLETNFAENFALIEDIELNLRVESENFTIPMKSLRYGFMVDLGKIENQNLDSQLHNIPSLYPIQKDFFLSYIPPQELAAIQMDQRRFFYGKEGLGFNPPVTVPVFTKLPINIGNTYLLRLIQYQLPEVILNGKAIPREKRLFIDEILHTPSSDILVTITPVRRNLDGSYTVLWQILKRFLDPQIIDLENYVHLE